MVNFLVSNVSISTFTPSIIVSVSDTPISKKFSDGGPLLFVTISLMFSTRLTRKAVEEMTDRVAVEECCLVSASSTRSFNMSGSGILIAMAWGDIRHSQAARVVTRMMI